MLLRKETKPEKFIAVEGTDYLQQQLNISTVSLIFLCVIFKD